MELEVKNRTVTGKKVKNLRKEGLVPGEIFGHGIENKHVSIDEKTFRNMYKTAGSHTVIQVSIEGGEKIPAVISEVQLHPLTRQPLSVLIQGVKADETIETSVPVEFKGEAPAEKEGLMVLTVLDEIAIEALPGKIPGSFEVDLSGLKTSEDILNVGNLTVPEGVKILLPEDTVIVSVTEAEQEEEAAPPAVEEAEEKAATEKTEPDAEKQEGKKEEEPSDSDKKGS